MLPVLLVQLERLVLVELLVQPDLREQLVPLDLVLLDLPVLRVLAVQLEQLERLDLVLPDLLVLRVLAVQLDLQVLVELLVQQDLRDQLDLQDLRDHSFFHIKSSRISENFFIY